MTQLEKILLGIVGALLVSWMGWVSLTVVSLASKAQTDSAQWKAINELRKFHYAKVTDAGN